MKNHKKRDAKTRFVEKVHKYNYSFVNKRRTGDCLLVILPENGQKNRENAVKTECFLMYKNLTNGKNYGIMP